MVAMRATFILLVPLLDEYADLFSGRNYIGASEDKKPVPKSYGGFHGTSWNAMKRVIHVTTLSMYFLHFFHG